MSVLISEGVVKVMLEGAARWRSEDWRTRRERGVECRFGRRVRMRCICERWFTWKWESMR